MPDADRDAPAEDPTDRSRQGPPLEPTEQRAHQRRTGDTTPRTERAISVLSALFASSTVIARAVLTLATSIDTPYTPKTLATCATASTVVWL